MNKIELNCIENTLPVHTCSYLRVPITDSHATYLTYGWWLCECCGEIRSRLQWRSACKFEYRRRISSFFQKKKITRRGREREETRGDFYQSRNFTTMFPVWLDFWIAPSPPVCPPSPRRGSQNLSVQYGMPWKFPERKATSGTVACKNFFTFRQECPFTVTPAGLMTLSRSFVPVQTILFFLPRSAMTFPSMDARQISCLHHK